MSTLEVRPSPGAYNTIAEISVHDAMTDLVRSSPAGVDNLDELTLRRLRNFTQAVLYLDGERALGEYDRYNATSERALDIDSEAVHDHIAGKKILVTGGTGLIGSRLMGLIAGNEPASLTSVSRGLTNPYTVVDGATYITGADIRNRSYLEKVVQDVDPDIIYHLAADKYNHKAEERVEHTLSTNVLGVHNIIEVARSQGVGQVVYASTGKASRPYSPDIYASSKKTGEWLMSRAAEMGSFVCSAVRFTHVVDDSNIRRKINGWIDKGEPIRLQSPNVLMYIQSALESAQLLLNAGVEAQDGKFKVQAIRELGMPVNLADLGFGALAKRDGRSPIYFQGVVPGYEDRAWPLLFGPEAGDRSPLINSLETHSAEPSVTSPAVDSFELDFVENERADKQLAELIAAFQSGNSGRDLRALNQGLSWAMLEARLPKVSRQTLSRIGRSIIRGQDRFGFSHEDQAVNDAIMRVAEVESV